MNSMDFEKIGKFIAKLRKDKKLTQLQLAELTSASDKTISKWENGNSFPDLAYQSKLCEALGIELDELHAGELNLKRRKRRKLRKLFTRLVIVYAAITIPLITFLCFFFVNNYDSTKLYSLETAGDSVEVVVKGILIETNKSDLLYIGTIDIWDYEIKDTDIISVDIYSSGKLIAHSNKIDDITVKYETEDAIDKDDLVVKITITQKNKKELNYEVELNLAKISREVGSDSINAFSELKLLSDEEIEENLKSAGFKKTEDFWKKEIKKAKNSVSIMYVPVALKLYYVDKTATIVKKVNYTFQTNSIDVYIYNESGEQDILFEQYTYNYSNEQLDCQVGVCSTLEEVLKTMNSYLILLTGE